MITLVQVAKPGNIKTLHLGNAIYARINFAKIVDLIVFVKSV